MDARFDNILIKSPANRRYYRKTPGAKSKPSKIEVTFELSMDTENVDPKDPTPPKQNIVTESTSVPRGLARNDSVRNMKINESVDTVKVSLPPKRPTVRFQLPEKEEFKQPEKVPLSLSNVDPDETQLVDEGDMKYEQARKRLAGQTPFTKEESPSDNSGKGSGTNSSPLSRDPLFGYDYAFDVSPVVVPPLSDLKPSTANATAFASQPQSVSSDAPTPLTNMSSIHMSTFLTNRTSDSYSIKLFDYGHSPSVINPFVPVATTPSTTLPAKTGDSVLNTNTRGGSISDKVKMQDPRSVVNYANTEFTPATRPPASVQRDQPSQGRQLVDMLAVYWSPETPAQGPAQSFLNRLSTSLEYSQCEDESVESLEVPVAESTLQQAQIPAQQKPVEVPSTTSTAPVLLPGLSSYGDSVDYSELDRNEPSPILRAVQGANDTVLQFAQDVTADVTEDAEATFEQNINSIVVDSTNILESTVKSVELPQERPLAVVAANASKTPAGGILDTSMPHQPFETVSSTVSTADTSSVALKPKDIVSEPEPLPENVNVVAAHFKSSVEEDLVETGVSRSKPSIGQRSARLPPVEPTPSAFEIPHTVPVVFPQSVSVAVPSGSVEPPVLELINFAPATVPLPMSQQKQQSIVKQIEVDVNPAHKLSVTVTAAPVGKTAQPPTESLFVLPGDDTASFVSEDSEEGDTDTGAAVGGESLEVVMAELSVSTDVMNPRAPPATRSTNTQKPIVKEAQSDFSCLDFTRTPTMVRIPPLPYSVYVKRAGLVTPLLRKFGGPVRLTPQGKVEQPVPPMEIKAQTAFDDSFNSEDSTVDLFQPDVNSFVTNLQEKSVMPATPSSISQEYHQHGLPGATQFGQRSGFVSEDRPQLSLDKFFASFNRNVMVADSHFAPVKAISHKKVPLTTIYPIQETSAVGDDEEEAGEVDQWNRHEEQYEDRLAADYGRFATEPGNTSLVNTSVANPADDSGLFTAATTITLDLDVSYQQQSRSVGVPRLAVVSQRPSSSKPADMKEIILTTMVGASASSTLCFCNKRKVAMKFRSKTIMIRFEPLDRTIETQFEDTENVFSVSQKLALIKANDELHLTVHFKPTLELPGVYSGVLKITSNRKSFVILLRGVVSQPVATIQVTNAVTIEPASAPVSEPVASFKPIPIESQSAAPHAFSLSNSATSAFVPSGELLAKQAQLRAQLAKQKEQSPASSAASSRRWTQQSSFPSFTSFAPRQNPNTSHVETHSAKPKQSSVSQTIPIAPARKVAAASGAPGLFFKRPEIHFGAVEVGTLTRVKVELCNPTDEEVTVFVGDPQLPFVVLHNEVTIRPRCYVKLPVRFLPVVGPKAFSAQLVAQSADGLFQATVNLSGSSTC